MRLRSSHNECIRGLLSSNLQIKDLTVKVMLLRGGLARLNLVSIIVSWFLSHNRGIASLMMVAMVPVEILDGEASSVVNDARVHPPSRKVVHFARRGISSGFLFGECVLDVATLFDGNRSRTKCRLSLDWPICVACGCHHSNVSMFLAMTTSRRSGGSHHCGWFWALTIDSVLEEKSILKLLANHSLCLLGCHDLHHHNGTIEKVQ